MEKILLTVILYISCKHNSVVFGQNFNISGCNFVNNSDRAIDALENANLTNCNFVGNSGTSTVVCHDSCIVNCNFTKNSVHNSGLSAYGAALDAFNSFIKNCRFIGNSADNGGAIRAGQCHIDNCIFKDNIANCYGSAIEIATPDETLTISNSIFSNNKAKLKKNTIGYPIINYANSAIVKAGNSSGLKISKCTGLVNNYDKYKVKTKIVASSQDSKEGKYLKITLKNTDFLNFPISGLKIKIKLNSKTYTIITEDKVR